jgi:DNA repair protein RecN (Recombination protein N)
MLATLRIKNLALVSDLTVEFQAGLNGITGETGAGKSILIGALDLLLGERADRTMIRSGGDSCAVEAVFDVARLRAAVDRFCEENGIEGCEHDQLLIRRVFSASGTNRQFINGSPVTLNLLKALGESLVDIHGAHEHQSLLHPARQLAILDAFGSLEKERAQFAAVARRKGEVEAAKAALIIDERTYAQQLDLLRFQVKEIAAARLVAGEDTGVEQAHQRASNAARLLELAQTALKLLDGDEPSVLTQAGALGRTLHELARVDAAARRLNEMHARAIELLRELQAEISDYADAVEIDPARLSELEERLNVLQSLKRKYGPTVEEVIAFGEEARRKLASLEERDTELERLNAELVKLDEQLARSGAALSANRRKVVPELRKAVAKQLAALAFKQSHFDVELAPAPATLNGMDRIEFQFAPNPGEAPRPLRDIASSGELARVMLALKTVLADVDEIPLLVFDEVDANVGGETGNAVGEKMRQIARNRQVLCITHLPQVAAHATSHYVVSKETKGGRTTSEIRLLDGEDRITELARMLGGQTEAARKHAKALVRDD